MKRRTFVQVIGAGAALAVTPALAVVKTKKDRAEEVLVEIFSNSLVIKMREDGTTKDDIKFFGVFTDLSMSKQEKYGWFSWIDYKKPAYLYPGLHRGLIMSIPKVQFSLYSIATTIDVKMHIINKPTCHYKGPNNEEKVLYENEKYCCSGHGDIRDRLEEATLYKMDNLHVDYTQHQHQLIKEMEGWNNDS